MSKYTSYWRKQDRLKQRWERYYFNQAQDALRSQMDGIMDSFYLYQTPQQIIERIPAIINREPISKLYLDLYKRVTVYFIKDQLNQLKGNSQDWEIKQQGVDPEGMENLWLSQVQDWVIMNAGDRIVSVTQSQRDRAIKIIRDITAQSVEEGLGTRETMRKIEQGIPAAWRNQSFWAQRIAWTEVLTAANEGHMRGAKATGLTLNKIWIARLDGRERESHRALHLQKVPMQDKFRLGAMEIDKPGDFKAGAAEVINCRCTVAFERI